MQGMQSNHSLFARTTLSLLSEIVQRSNANEYIKDDDGTLHIEFKIKDIKYNWDSIVLIEKKLTNEKCKCKLYLYQADGDFYKYNWKFTKK